METFKRFAIILFIFSLFLTGKNAYADLIKGSSGADWRKWELSDLNNNGTPYWDHSSWDGPNKNIGNCLTSDNCGAYSPHPGAIDYWGMLHGGADSNFYFEGSAGGSDDDFTLLFALASLRTTNVFGWYETDSNGIRINQDNHIIFNGLVDDDGANHSFTLPQFYGFYFSNTTSGRTYYTQSDYNSDDKGQQHFAIFNDGNAFWMGIEDLPLGQSDDDYNDMILRDPPSSVPEPSTLYLLAAGIFGLGILRRFKV